MDGLDQIRTARAVRSLREISESTEPLCQELRLTLADLHQGIENLGSGAQALQAASEAIRSAERQRGRKTTPGGAEWLRMALVSILSSLVTGGMLLVWMSWHPAQVTLDTRQVAQMIQAELPKIEPPMPSAAGSKPRK